MKKLLSLYLLACVTIAVPVHAQLVLHVGNLSSFPDTNPGNGICITILGSCSLRAAIEEANASPNGALPDVIEFSLLPISAGTAVINISGSGLPAITDPVIIDGTTASGEVILNGTTSDAGVDGLVLGAGSDGSIIRGLTVGGFDGSNGITLYSNGNEIQQNHVGVSDDGTAYPNRIGIHDYGNGNLIGGVDKGNVIGLNTLNGIYINEGISTRIRGNYVGMDFDGNNIGNGYVGIVLFRTEDATVGGPEMQYGNRVGYNDIGISLGGSTNPTVRNNYVGTDEAGNDRGNVLRGIKIEGRVGGARVGGHNSFGNVIGFNDVGIYIFYADSTTANNFIRGNFIGIDRAGRDIGNDIGIGYYSYTITTTIGYPPNAAIPLNPEKANTIAYNHAEGVGFYGSSSSDAPATIRGNNIYENGTLGIDLGGDGITPNDDSDFDSGPNDEMNYPDVDRAFYRAGSDEIVVEFSVSSDDFWADYPLTIDVYLADDVNSGEGKTYIGTHLYDVEGVADTFRVAASAISWVPEDYVVLTATDAEGNTSEFSPPAGALGGVGSVAERQPVDVPTTDVALDVKLSAYPNPFQGQTQIQYTLPEAGQARLEVFDLLGRSIRVLVDQQQAAGAYTARFDAGTLPRGTYLYRLTTGQRAQSGVLQLIRAD
ncbi:MAG: T9SS type A sorting domain-containing protein [Bacteroidota bacterium]